MCAIFKEFLEIRLSVLFQVSEWQYRVTVVRCGTLLHVEDPNAVDETLNDFTFSQNELQKELDEDRAQLYM